MDLIFETFRFETLYESGMEYVRLVLQSDLSNHFGILNALFQIVGLL